MTSKYIPLSFFVSRGHEELMVTNSEALSEGLARVPVTLRDDGAFQAVIIELTSDQAAELHRHVEGCRGFEGKDYDATVHLGDFPCFTGRFVGDIETLATQNTQPFLCAADRTDPGSDEVEICQVAMTESGFTGGYLVAHSVNPIWDELRNTRVHGPSRMSSTFREAISHVDASLRRHQRKGLLTYGAGLVLAADAMVGECEAMVGIQSYEESPWFPAPSKWKLALERLAEKQLYWPRPPFVCFGARGEEVLVQFSGIHTVPIGPEIVRAAQHDKIPVAWENLILGSYFRTPEHAVTLEGVLSLAADDQPYADALRLCQQDFGFSGWVEPEPEPPEEQFDEKGESLYVSPLEEP